MSPMHQRIFLTAGSVALLLTSRQAPAQTVTTGAAINPYAATLNPYAPLPPATTSNV
jgi:hypothetical protein